ncbi:hypothetical protein [Lichenibacterium dinghuense]|uniref:hypothetical protein n=1 Tax=Lichenibacterium dinghuense TaxID=2895977 RepID=UPI001F38D66A|nr:hypothetical protein [Lichenibacterium sp. 6Y81]
MGEVPTLTRRGLVRGAGAAIGATAAGLAGSALASPAPDLDVGLLDLIGRHAGALTACVQAEDEADLRARDAAAAEPPWPDALRWRSTDFPRTSYGRAASDPIGDKGERRYIRRGVEWLRTSTFTAQWTPEAEARRREIVEAYDRWCAERHEVDVRTGYAAADQARRAAVVVLREIEREIAETPARTLPGLRAKASWVADHVATDPYADEDLGEAFAREVAGFGEAAS